MEDNARDHACQSQITHDKNHNVGESFGRITIAIEEVAGQIMEVSAAVQEISASSDEVAQTIDKIAVIASENAEGTRNVSEMTAEQLTGMDTLREASESLANMAGELKSIVSRFEV